MFRKLGQTLLAAVALLLVQSAPVGSAVASRPTSAGTVMPSGMHITKQGKANQTLFGGPVACENEVYVPTGKWTVIVPYTSKAMPFAYNGTYRNFQAGTSYLSCKEGGVAIRIFSPALTDTTKLTVYSGLNIRYTTSIAAAADTVDAHWFADYDVDSLYIRPIGSAARVEFKFR